MTARNHTPTEGERRSGGETVTFEIDRDLAREIDERIVQIETSRLMDELPDRFQGVSRAEVEEAVRRRILR